MPIRPANPRWLAAVVLMACSAAGLMVLPLSGLPEGGVLVPPAAIPVATAGRGDTIVGERGDPHGFADVLAPPGLFERRLEHLRLDHSKLRSYVFVLAKPAYARKSGADDAQWAGEPPEPAVAGAVAPRPPVAIGVPINVTTVASTPLVAKRKTAVVLQEGDALDAVLAATGMTPTASRRTATLLSDQLDARGERPTAGDVVEALFLEGDQAGHPGFSRISIVRGGVAIGVVARGDDGSYAPVAVEDERAAARTAAGFADVSGPLSGGATSLRGGLRLLAVQGGLDPSLVDDVVRICAKDVDLGAPAGADDAVAILFSPETSDGRTRPEIAFVSVVTGGRTRNFYRFAMEGAAAADYFDDEGRSASRLLLRKPVAAGRLGDGFGWRIHPVLKDRRFHEGVDYAAPFGSPIVAAGAGVVERIDEQWGYGKYVRIRHDRGYETIYAHIAGAAPGLRVGTRVAQGDTIAFVGSTGLSTGPHLYYEVRINGRDVDPLRVKLDGGAALQGDALTAFQTRRRRIDMLLGDARGGAGVRVAGMGP